VDFAKVFRLCTPHAGSLKTPSRSGMDARQTNCSDGLTAFGCSSFALFAMLFYHQYYIDYVAYFSNLLFLKGI
jgi:hypothetical protein